MAQTPVNDSVGILQEIFAELPLVTRDHLLFNFALAFENDPVLQQCPATAFLLSTVTAINFSRNDSLDVDKFQAFARLPLTGLRHLDCQQLNLRPAEKEAAFLSCLSQCPAFNNLETLSFAYCDLQSIDPLTNGPNTFPHLTSLNLDFNRNLDLHSLVTTTSFPNLKSLHVSSTGLTLDTASKLSQSTTFRPQLTELKFNATYFPQKDATALALLRSPFCSSIKTLFATFAGTTDAFNTIVDEGLLGSVEKLTISLYGPGFEVPDLSRFFSSPLVSNLTDLDVRGNRSLTAETFEALAKAPAIKQILNMPFSHHLTTIPDFPHSIMALEFPQSCRGTNADINFISTAPCFATLESLDLSNLVFDQERLSIETLFTKSKNLSNINRLCIRRSGSIRLTSDMLDMILTSSQLSNLKHLNLQGQAELRDNHISLITDQLSDPTDPSLGLKFSKLDNFNLSNGSLSPGVVGKLNCLKNLTRLDFDRKLHDRDLLSLISLDPDLSTPSRPVARLSHLNNLNFPAAGFAFKAMANSPILEQLAQLVMTVDDADSRSVTALITAPQASNLTILMVDNWFDPPDCDLGPANPYCTLLLF